MEDQLKKFLRETFGPYGNFPSRKDIEQELLANLIEKYRDMKRQGKSDNEAYQATVDSFGDVAEIMGQVRQMPHEEAEEPSLGKSLKETFRLARRSKSKFSATELKQSDLSGTQLADADFSFSSLAGSTFDDAHLAGATFRGSELRGATFKNPFQISQNKKLSCANNLAK
jgi:uncharacterized protein YjbI with pentapeptide repeats